MEKSPPNIIRADKIKQHFNNVKFICLVRNPYAQIQSNLRRYNTDIKEAASNYINYLKFQKENLTKAEGLIVNAIEITPNSATYYDTYGWVLFQKGEYKLAEEKLFKAMCNTREDL